MLHVVLPCLLPLCMQPYPMQYNALPYITILTTSNQAHSAMYILTFQRLLASGSCSQLRAITLL